MAHLNYVVSYKLFVNDGLLIIYFCFYFLFYILLDFGIFYCSSAIIILFKQQVKSYSVYNIAIQ